MGLEVGMGQSVMPENTHSPPCLPEEWSLHLLFSFSFSFSFDDGGIRNRFVPLRSLGTLMEKQIEIVFWRRFAKPLQGRFPFSFFPSTHCGCQKSLANENQRDCWASASCTFVYLFIFTCSECFQLDGDGWAQRYENLPWKGIGVGSGKMCGKKMTNNKIKLHINEASLVPDVFYFSKVSWFCFLRKFYMCIYCNCCNTKEIIKNNLKKAKYGRYWKLGCILKMVWKQQGQIRNEESEVYLFIILLFYISVTLSVKWG